jgi:RNA polymerase sigma-70 factor, ECF subfamily
MGPTDQHGGAEGGFEALYHTLYPSLWRYINRLTGDPDVADDVTQDAFVRLLARPELGADAARLWIFTVATNLVRDRARMRSRRTRLLTATPIAPVPEPLADHRLEREERVDAVRRALGEIPERDRKLILMREEGFRYDEIASAVGVAPGSVGTLIARALRRFTEVYTPLEE